MLTMPKIQNRSTKGDPILQALPEACCDELKAVEFMEVQRWGDHPACPRCGSLDVYMMKDKTGAQRQSDFRWLCRDCKKAGAKAQFTVRTNTVFEDSKIPLRHWCFAYWRAATSKKGVSALEIHRQTGLSYKSSLFMLHRIRFGMSGSAPEMLGAGGKDVECDETYVGGRERYYGKGVTGRPGPRSNKPCVMALVERGGSVKTMLAGSVTGKTFKQMVRENVDRSARILTDEAMHYRGIGKEFARGHESVKHQNHEYVRTGTDIHSNTVEGFFSIVKRGLDGIYHSVSKKHLPLYLNEFSYRYNRRGMEDGERTATAIRLSEGKRLMYKEPIRKSK
jgi:transposase-like protein